MGEATALATWVRVMASPLLEKEDPGPGGRKALSSPISTGTQAQPCWGLGQCLTPWTGWDWAGRDTQARRAGHSRGQAWAPPSPPKPSRPAPRQAGGLFALALGQGCPASEARLAPVQGKRDEDGASWPALG